MRNRIGVFATQRRRLVRERMLLLEQIRQTLRQADSEYYAEVAGWVHDPEDESVASLLVDQNLAQVDHDIARLRQIEQALSRMDRGGYGLCEDCGGEIELPRLRAMPEVSRCLTCQGVRERHYQNPPRPSL